MSAGARVKSGGEPPQSKRLAQFVGGRISRSVWTACALAPLLVAGDFSASAQSNGVPGDTDYAKFSSFITDRNIFDPNRVPHSRTSVSRPRTTRTTRRASGPAGITLVGTMSYEKGLFAFFNAGDSDLKKILAVGGEIAGYTVKEVSANSVILTGKDKKEFTMKIGDQLHQDGSTWKLADDSSGGGSSASEPVAAATESDSSANGTTEAPAAAPSANLAGNEVLKRLMEKRAKENQ